MRKDFHFISLLLLPLSQLLLSQLLLSQLLLSPLKTLLTKNDIRLILKTSAVSQTEFQSTIFELSQRILSYDKKYSYQIEGTVGSNRKKKLFSFTLHWLHILQCKSVSVTDRREKAL